MWSSKVFLVLLALVPLGWLRMLGERTLARAFLGAPSVPLENQVSWRDYQHELVSRLTKAALRDLYQLGIDLLESFRFAPDDLASWPGRIPESEEDPVTPGKRAELRQTYPQARLHTFDGARHTPWTSHREEYVSVVREFLDQQQGV